LITAWLFSNFRGSYHSISVIINKTNLLCPFTHHNQFSLVVTFRIWVNYSPLIVTLSWPVWLFRFQQDHFGFYIPRGYTSVVVCFVALMGIEPISLGHLLQSTTTCCTPFSPLRLTVTLTHSLYKELPYHNYRAKYDGLSFLLIK
jgi:hypothetical protein